MAKRPKKKDLLDWLLATAYLPDEVPPLITAKHFAAYCKMHRADLAKNETAAKSLNTLSDKFSVPRSIGTRRPVALVHPEAQLTLSSVIANNYNKIKSHVCKKRVGRSFYFVFAEKKSRRAFRGLDFPRWRKAARRVASNHPYLLKADIERFFYTAYTHSLEWAARGKDQVKAERLKLKKGPKKPHWSSTLDKALQACQSRETQGIPVGPDTSRLISEILLVGAESQSDFRHHLAPGKSVRLIDDYIIGFLTKDEAELGLRELRDGLQNFNLSLNDRKTSIIESRKFFDEDWKSEIGAVVLTAKKRQAQITKLEALIDAALRHADARNEYTPVEWACNRIERATIHRGNEVQFTESLLRLARDYPKCVPKALSILINNRESWSGTRAVKNRISACADQMLEINIPRKNEFEVAWVLFCCAIFEIQISASKIKLFKEPPGSIVLTMLHHMKHLKLVKVGFPRWKWRKFLGYEGGVRSCYWLPLYEAVRRKWTRDPVLIKAIQSDAFFGDLLNKDVTFLEDGILHAKRLDIRRRTYKRESASAPYLRKSTSRTIWASSFWEDMATSFDEGY